MILGCAAPSPDEVNIGRVVALRMGCGNKVPGWTVMRNCASGMQSLDSAIANIRSGRSNLVLAGGVDALSRAPLLFSDAMVLWLSNWYAAKSLGQKAALVAQLKLSYLAPVIGLMKGLTDPMVGLLMGQTAENIAYRFGITRREMDEFSARSHQRVLAAQKAGHYDGEVVPLYDKAGKLYAADDGVREDSTPENLAKLKPFFDRKYGNVTAGNSSQVTDGAAWLVIASERAVEKHELVPKGRIVDSEWAGLDPAQMGLGPVHAATPILQTARSRARTTSMRGKSTRRSRRRSSGASAHGRAPITAGRSWDSRSALGALDETKLNVDGGAIALGHPVGASGARIVLHVLNVLDAHRRPARHRRDLHRRRPGRRDAGRADVGPASDTRGASSHDTGITMQHWTLESRRRRSRAARLRQVRRDDQHALGGRARRAQRGAGRARSRPAAGG